MGKSTTIAAIAVAAAALVFTKSAASWNEPWSDEQRNLIGSLSLDELPVLATDPSNRVADDPRAAELGKLLFNDTRLSGNGKVACATCHIASRQFQDGTSVGHGVGQTSRRTMPISGTAYSPFLFWDGRKDSQWAQALGPLESSVEHGTDRTALATEITAHYRSDYEKVFGLLPTLTSIPLHASPEGTPSAKAAWASMRKRDRQAVNLVFANIGKAIAAYERTIQPTETRFDRYARALRSGARTADIMSQTEIEGLSLFIGKGSCINCHNGPLLTDNHFHNTGVPPTAGNSMDVGRALGALQVQNDPFNCLGPYSDAVPADCAELTFIEGESEALVRAYKTPSLRDVVSRPPYMHGGQFATMQEVLHHYNDAPPAPAGHTELEPLHLKDGEIDALQAFLASLSVKN